MTSRKFSLRFDLIEVDGQFYMQVPDNEMAVQQDAPSPEPSPEPAPNPDGVSYNDLEGEVQGFLGNGSLTEADVRTILADECGVVVWQGMEGDDGSKITLVNLLRNVPVEHYHAVLRRLAQWKGESDSLIEPVEVKTETQPTEPESESEPVADTDDWTDGEFGTSDDPEISDRANELVKASWREFGETAKKFAESHGMSTMTKVMSEHGIRNKKAWDEATAEQRTGLIKAML